MKYVSINQLPLWTNVRKDLVILRERLVELNRELKERLALEGETGPRETALSGRKGPLSGFPKGPPGKGPGGGRTGP